jgi:regulator of protease activity HflC (stomatin/prohibitin superfamily)
MVRQDEYIDSSVKMIKKIASYSFIALILLVIFFGCWYTIPAGHKGIVLTFSKPSDVAKGEGLHFKIPIVQSVVKMDTRTIKYEADLTAASKDLQDVSTKIAINYHLSPDSVVEVYRGIGIDYAAKIIYPLEQESNKASTAQFVAGELITKREEVKSNMETLLREKLAPRGIVVESISIIDFKFSPSFSQAIEAKVTAEQNALAAKNKLEQVKYEAEQRIAQAEGEARAIEIQVRSINQAGGDNYVKLKEIEKWSGNLPYVVGGNSFVDLRTFGLMDTSNSSK